MDSFHYSHPAIKFSKVSKSYAAANVFHEIYLELGSGSILGLTGLNGPGWTYLGFAAMN